MLEIVLSVKSKKAAKKHVCDYCGQSIPKGSKYYFIQSRKVKAERFPVTIKACQAHTLSLLPLSLFLKRAK